MQRANAAPQLMTLSVVAVAGLLYVKWIPYYGQANIAASAHSIGASILVQAISLPPISLPSLAMVAQSFPLRILVTVTAAVVSFGLLGGALAAGLRF
jgi:hypothetical protein